MTLSEPNHFRSHFSAGSKDEYSSLLPVENKAHSPKSKVNSVPVGDDRNLWKQKERQGEEVKIHKRNKAMVIETREDIQPTPLREVSLYPRLVFRRFTLPFFL